MTQQDQSMLDEIHADALKSYRKHINSTRGQEFTEENSYDTHLIRAAIAYERRRIEGE